MNFLCVILPSLQTKRAVLNAEKCEKCFWNDWHKVYSLSNNGLGHFEQKYSFMENGYFWRFCHHLLKGDNFCRQEFGSLVQESLEKERLLLKERICSLWEKMLSFKSWEPSKKEGKYFFPGDIFLEGLPIPLKFYKL